MVVMDLEQLEKNYLDFLQKEKQEALESQQNEIEAFKSKLNDKGIALTDKDFNYFQSIGVVINYPNILRILEPDLEPDKEGLVNWEKLCNLYSIQANGYFNSSEYTVTASRLFRRGYSICANWAPSFIDLFWSLNKADLEASILLDYNIVKIGIDNRYPLEADQWYGPEFKSNISTIDDGVTRLHPPLDIEERINSFLFNSAYSLDTYWYTEKNIKTFQAMEFKTEDITIDKDGSSYHPVRYVHAEYDLEKKTFRHFDGAMQFFTPDEYFSRRQTDFNHDKKSSSHIKAKSEKLFKLNGAIDTETWKELTSHFFTANPLIHEYFTGKYPIRINEILEKTRQNSNKS